MKKSAVLLLPLLLLGATPATAPRQRTLTDYETHAAALRKKLPKHFMIIVQVPFVVIGDGTPDSVKASAANTVKWAVDHLKKAYFDKDPADILDIYLFKDKTSYDKYNEELFGGAPDTPFGYYSPTHKALIMNIATGGGTLVHEIVHPFIEANFPDCPPWFNEGLGSLYEQSAEKDGDIVGLTNWRLAGLQKAITAKKVPSFETLFEMDADTFYTQDKGTNYAQARYLLYYLQQQNLLHAYYKAFLKNREKDPTGFETLKEILKEKDLPAFQKRWEKWVMTLRFP
jgi:hypothetical protein